MRFLPNAITACALLHNVLLGQLAEKVAALLSVLEEERLHGEVDEKCYPRGD